MTLTEARAQLAVLDGQLQRVRKERDDYQVLREKLSEDEKGLRAKREAYSNLITALSAIELAEAKDAADNRLG
jgi:hypothetical protein